MAGGTEFYRRCGLPDTMQSWFLVTQLHLWMCLVRLKQVCRRTCACDN